MAQTKVLLNLPTEKQQYIVLASSAAEKSAQPVNTTLSGTLHANS